MVAWGGLRDRSVSCRASPKACRTRGPQAELLVPGAGFLADVLLAVSPERNRPAILNHPAVEVLAVQETAGDEALVSIELIAGALDRPL